MSSIDTRSPFFPGSKTNQAQNKGNVKALERNSLERSQEIEGKTANDAKVSIPESIKDFSRIKKAVDQSAPIDNSAKIADLKARIQAGTYNIDYDSLADKMLESEF